MDTVLRAMTNDGAFRVITTRTTETVRSAIAAQNVSGQTARLLADLITGTILVRETMAPKLRVQGIVQGAGGGNVVADAHPDGSTRGLVRGPKGQRDVALADGALLQMMRTLPSGHVHKGVVQMREKGGVSEAIMAYMQESEQVTSMMSVGCLVEDDKVIASGGYIVQLLPEVTEGPLMVMTERLKDFVTMEPLLAGEGSQPTALMQELLYGMDFTPLEESELRFQCQCSEVRVLASLATLTKPDLEELLSDPQALEIECDYCGNEYRVAPEHLRGLLEAT